MLDDICFEVKLTTKGFTDEISWNLGECSGLGPYSGPSSIHQCCIAPGTYQLECKDTYGDGWRGGYIEVDGKRYCENFINGFIMSAQITIQGIQNGYRNIVSF